MNRATIKLLTTCICLTFVISAVFTAAAVNVKNENTQTEESKIEKITLIRFGPDGSETPIEIELELKEGEDYFEAILEKCKKILENDVELQTYFQKTDDKDDNDDKNEPGLNITKNSWVVSWGRGLHIKTKYCFRFFFAKRLLSLIFPLIGFKVFRPWVFCKYANDTKAKTIINPRGSNNTINITGNHSLLLHNFVGLALWSGRFDKSRIDILPRLLIGKAKTIAYKQ